jgi:hypothetical protein
MNGCDCERCRNLVPTDELEKDSLYYSIALGRGYKPMEDLLRFCFQNKIRIEPYYIEYGNEDTDGWILEDKHVKVVRFNVSDNKIDNIYRIINTVYNMEKFLIVFDKVPEAGHVGLSVQIDSNDERLVEKTIISIYKELADPKPVVEIDPVVQAIINSLDDFNDKHYNIRVEVKKIRDDYRFAVLGDYNENSIKHLLVMNRSVNYQDLLYLSDILDAETKRCDIQFKKEPTDYEKSDKPTNKIMVKQIKRQ